MNTRTTRTLMAGLLLGTLVSIAGPSTTPLAGASATSVRAQEDPEADAYREARRAINRGQFERAIDLFAELRDRYPSGRYAPDSYYWQAFSLYRLDALREALRLLEMQTETFPEARVTRDARDLELRIRAHLAQRGDAREAEQALREAEAALAHTVAPGALAASLYVSEAALARSAMVSEMATRQAEMALERAAAGLPPGPGPAGLPPGPVLAGSRRAQEGCEEEDVQHAALQALMQVDSERALPILRRVLQRRDECSIPLRKQAIFVLSQHDPAEAEDLLIDLARNDPDPEIKETAVFWLSQSGSERALDVLLDILGTTDDPKLQEKAIFAVSQHRSARVAELLRSYALDASKPSRVREQAIFWMSQHADLADPSFLIELYGQLGETRLKEQVFFALSQIRDGRAIDWMLERALDSGEPTALRKQALFWAGQHRSVDLARLNGLYGRLTDREMKEQLIFLYSQRSEPEAVERLIEIARAEKDPELRKRVIFWLGQTGDERAIAYLLELVGEPR